MFQEKRFTTVDGGTFVLKRPAEGKGLVMHYYDRHGEHTFIERRHAAHLFYRQRRINRKRAIEQKLGKLKALLKVKRRMDSFHPGA